MKVLIFVYFFLICSSVGFAEKPKALEALIQLAQEKSDSLSSINQSIEALKSEIKARDSVLSPLLTTEVGVSRDQQKLETGVQKNNRSRYFDLELSKEFFTGTSVAVTTGSNFSETVTASPQYISFWSAELSQSLWRNSFGLSTRLRQKADASELKARRYDLEFQKQSLLFEIESLFWDLSAGQKEEEIRSANIEKSLSLEKWISDRVRRSAAETSDLIQVRALSSSRRIALLENQNRLRALKTQLEGIIPGADVKNLKISMDEVSQQSRVLSIPSEAIRLDTMAALSLAAKNKAEAEQVSDLLNPELDVFLKYGKNGVNENSAESIQEAQSSNQSSTLVGLRFSMDLGFSLRREKQKAANLKASSQSLLADSKTRQSRLELKELSENLKNLQALVKESSLLSELQKRKSFLEKQRYEIGQSTIFQSLTFDIEAGEAEVNYFRTLAALKKEEARLRLFVSEGELL